MKKNVMNKAFVYAIYPNDIQRQLCLKTFGCCRLVYNQMLIIQQKRYEIGQKHLSKIDANNYCNHVLKKEYSFLREVDSYSLTNAIFHLEDGYKRFFAHLGGFPRYKNKHTARKSYTTNFKNQNIAIGANFIKLPKLGKVKAKIHRFPKHGWSIKTATIEQNPDFTWQVAILFEYEEKIENLPVKDEKTLGLDYKSNGLYINNLGKCSNMPNFTNEYANKLKKAQRKLSRKKKGGCNYKKQKRKIAKIHQAIVNKRKNYLQEKSTAITKQFDYICVEDLNMRALANKCFGNGKTTMNNAYGMFLMMLDYKLKQKGGQLVKVDKWFPSSQLCNCCGYKNTKVKDLNIRKWICPNCGMFHDRDQNAAINIKKEGLRILRLKIIAT